MSTAALLRPRGLPATRNFGWGWLRVGRHWKVKTSGSLCEVSPGHQYGDSPKPQVIDGRCARGRDVHRVAAAARPPLCRRSACRSLHSAASSGPSYLIEGYQIGRGGGHQADGVARDHPLLVGRNAEDADARTLRGKLVRFVLILLRIYLDAEPI